ncbi:MAG: putative metal-binding motif-containing protein, partial [Myxococcota bacterium]|nr:putative metal-binding motif-containing protein [Myxococcota bacterium]
MNSALLDPQSASEGIPLVNAARSLALTLVLASLSSCPDDTVVYQDFYLSVTSEVPADGLSIDRLVLTFRNHDSGVLGLFGQFDSDVLRYEVSLPTVADITNSAYIVQINSGEIIRGDVLAVIWGLHANEDRPLVSWSGSLDLDSNGVIAVRLDAIAPTCDVDGDGLLDCSIEGCCSSADTILEDCDDSNAASHPLAAVPACIPCEPQTDYNCDGQIDRCPDRDGDNAADCDATVDCDPDDSSVHTSAEEICDGKDNDCNGVTDEKFTDTDADGTKDCVDDDIDGDGVANDMDCAPLDGATYPGATELCDGVDNDCNDATDDSPGCVEWENDWDGDGILPGQDCNNYDSKIFPGSTYAGCCIPDTSLSPEAVLLACDFDCDGNPNLCSDDDDDGDGYSNTVDCPGGQQDPTIYPGAPEKCGDGIDQDCLFGDQNCESVVDVDGDQYGAEVDCDDSDPTVYPNAPELCVGKDNNCNSFIDDGNPEASIDCLNPDPDRQFGLCALAENLGTTVCAQNTDNPALPVWASEQVNGKGQAVICIGYYPPPLAETLCDNQDEDCDGQVDEDFEWVEIHSASDGSNIVLAKGDSCGTGACLGGNVVCHPAALSRDISGQLTCDSLSNQSSENSGGGPGVSFCDGIDNDCDGIVDGHSLPLAQTTCKQLGVCGAEPELVQTACVDGVWQCGYTMDAYDGETELRCDGLDNDCDGNVDEDLSWENVPFGAPCDGTGECGPGIVTCNSEQQAVCSTNPSGPQAEAQSELCDEKDNDCDGLTDEGQYWEWNGIQYPLNSLCEGIGECGVGVVECSDSTLLPVCSTNLDGTASESSSEVCDGKDNDCDGLTDDDLFYGAQPVGALCDGIGECGAGIVECAVDGSLSATCSTNVNGASSSDTVELCDGLDNDCDGVTDEGFAWTDPVSNTQIPLSSPCDGIGECDLGVVVCAPGDSTIAVCSTNTDGTQPQSDVEVCDGLDNDCDGQTDNGLGWFDPELNAVVPLGSPCDGIGQCGTGIVECANDGSNVATCSTNPNGSDYIFQVEICNNLDDDCDGLTDDVVGTATPGVTCTLSGACNPANVTATCIAGNWSCDYSIVVGYEVSEQSCDGIDNDCDGLTDEAGLVVPTECDKPGVCSGA